MPSQSAPQERATQSVAGDVLVERTDGISLYSFDHQTLGDRSYLLIDERSGTAAVIDPQRELQPYVDAASSRGSHIAYALETHLHNDFVSGARCLAAEQGATVVACAGDYRSAIGTSLLERAGVPDLIHVADGLAGWQAAGGQVERSR